MFGHLTLVGTKPVKIIQMPMNGFYETVVSNTLTLVILFINSFGFNNQHAHTLRYDRGMGKLGNIDASG